MMEEGDIFDVKSMTMFHQSYVICCTNASIEHEVTSNHLVDTYLYT